MPKNNSEYAKIHILLNERGINDETYRSILWGNFNKGTSKDLNYKEKQILIGIIKSNFKPIKTAIKKLKKPNKHCKTVKTKTVSPKQTKYIRDMIKKDGDIFAPDNYLSAIIHRPVTLADIESLSVKEGIIIIDALKRRVKK